MIEVCKEKVVWRDAVLLQQGTRWRLVDISQRIGLAIVVDHVHMGDVGELLRVTRDVLGRRRNAVGDNVVVRWQSHREGKAQVINLNRGGAQDPNRGSAARGVGVEVDHDVGRPLVDVLSNRASVGILDPLPLDHPFDDILQHRGPVVDFQTVPCDLKARVVHHAENTLNELPHRPNVQVRRQDSNPNLVHAFAVRKFGRQE
mmetsp:Transcript_1396/g.3099  ORF Transcript_1396/g.3099 Transcript_1396/m.3099 type:complete len:202 (-) Transcript_1396:907-1512(-)